MKEIDPHSIFSFPDFWCMKENNNSEKNSKVLLFAVFNKGKLSLETESDSQAKMSYSQWKCQGDAQSPVSSVVGRFLQDFQDFSV